MKQQLIILLSITLFLSCSRENDIIEEEEVNLDYKISTTDMSPLRSATVAIYSQVINVSDFDSVADAVAAIDSTEGASLYFPCGLYKIDAIDTAKTDLYFKDFVHGLQIFGDGTCSEIVIRDFNEENSVRLINIEDSNSVIISDLLLNGNRNEAFHNAKQGHNIFINGSSGISINNITSIESEGDAIYIFESNKIDITNSFINNANRNGITLGVGNESSDITIIGNNFGSDIYTQQIDLEGNEPFKNIMISENNFEYLDITLNFSGQYAIVISELVNDEGIISEISNNNFNQNSFLIRSSKGVSITGNIDIGKTQIDRASKKISFTNNNFSPIPDGRTATALRYGIVIREVGGLEPNDIKFKFNTIILHDAIPVAIWAEDVLNSSFTNTTISSPSSTTNKTGFIFKAQDTNMNVYLAGNSFDSTINVPVGYQGAFDVNCTGNDCL